MPATRQGGGYTLTFAKRNKDIQNLLADKKNKGIIITDYICEAIRFFEQNKNNINKNNNEPNVDLIEKIVEQKIKETLNKIPYSKLEDNTTKNFNNVSLESNLDGISIDDD